ncbi:hypothetical protein Acr_06g0011760 [Actinidia rufa]|uniref:Disease resistance protein winged helix domain-containing protein n=1 Tax=Actinidia rufa TaxID=165716 RepID=A0A7J0ESP0_9ERIC|nr:hypothetical protein Acr_06g0011760 [Actinidia rufa]
MREMAKAAKESWSWLAAEQVGDRSSGDSSRAYTSTWEEETIVGFEEEVLIIKEQLDDQVRKQLDVISIVGMAGLEDFQVPVWKLIWLWVAEGFIRETREKSLEDVAEEYLMELIGRSLVLVSRRRYDGGVKACAIHDLLRDFCINQAEKECFLQQNFRVLPVSYFAQPKDLFIDDSPSTLNTSIFGFATHSGCTKSELADLDYAWYEFVRVLRTSDGMISINRSKLEKLVHLRDFLAGTPNIRKLGIRDCIVKNGLFTFPDTDFLNHLQELKLWCGRFGSWPIRLGGIRFPTNLRKLTLMESTVKWTEMSTLGKSLPNLEVLKLMQVACVGKCWKTSDGDFPQLKFLKLVAIPIEEWEVSSNPFPRLQRLVLIRCCGLQSIPSEIGEVPTLQMIEVRDCNTCIANSAHKIKEEQLNIGNKWLQIVDSGNGASPRQLVSWDEEANRIWMKMKMISGSAKNSEAKRSCKEY